MSAPDLRSRVLTAASREPVPARQEHRRSRAARAGAVVVVMVVALFSLGGVRPGDRGEVALYGTFASWLVLAGAAAWIAMSRGGQMTGRPRAVLLGVVLALAPGLLVSAALFGGMSWPAADPGVRAHVVCFAVASGVALAPLVFALWLRGATDPVQPRVTGAALGAAAGGLGALFIDLHCPATYAMHVAFGHVLPVVVLAALGAAIGPRFVAPVAD